MTTARNLPGLLAVPFLLVLMTECQPKLDAALIERDRLWTPSR